MESYCVFLMGQFIAMQRFADDFGVYSVTEKGFIIEAPWQSAFQCSGPVGAFIGVFLAGPITSWIGYRWTTIGGLMFLNAAIFIFYFGNSQGMFFAAQILEGIPWGIFIANAPAYCAEIVPMRLRAPATQMLQMFWAIGSIIVGGITYHYQKRNDPTAYRFVRSHRCPEKHCTDSHTRVPIALQWMFPTPLAILLFIAPESPWWLVRKGRLAEAEKAVKRLGRASATDNPADQVSMMRRTIDLEKTEKQPSLIELWRGTDRYRTLIVCGVYASQNLTGNLIANQAVYFFKRESNHFLLSRSRLTQGQRPAWEPTPHLHLVSSLLLFNGFSS
jgi:SP family general alpha glucoside:H+ symporter-like MFS transporter